MVPWTEDIRSIPTVGTDAGPKIEGTKQNWLLIGHKVIQLILPRAISLGVDGTSMAIGRFSLFGTQAHSEIKGTVSIGEMDCQPLKSC